MRIYVDLYGMREANYRMPAIRNRVEDTGRLVGVLRCRLSGEIAGRHQIGQRINEVCRDIRMLEVRIEELYQVTNVCIEQYAAAVEENTKNAEAFI